MGFIRVEKWNPSLQNYFRSRQERCEKKEKGRKELEKKPLRDEANAESELLFQRKSGSWVECSGTWLAVVNVKKLGENTWHGQELLVRDSWQRIK